MFFGFLGFSISGIILILIGFHHLNKKRKIEQTPTSKIRSLAMGLVEIKGRALPADIKDIPLLERGKDISPFTKKKCVYYYMLIEEYNKRGKEEGRWAYVDSRLYKNPFYVQDETGKILINPNYAIIELSTTFEEKSNFGKNPSKVVMDYLKENNIKFEGFLGMNKTMRYTEKAIFVDGEVYVMGEAMSSGKMSSDSCENIVIGKKGKRGFYYISNNSEMKILKKFNMHARTMFILGGTLFCIGIIFFMLIY